MRGPKIMHAALVLLVGLNVYAWQSVLQAHEPELRVSILDVGQGDSIFIESPSGIQMLIDGGPDRSVLRRLPREMGLFDRSIDIVVATHPDKDHIAGLYEVFRRYRVSTFISSGVQNNTAHAHALEQAVESESDGLEIFARRGMRIHLGNGAYADVLYPDRDVSSVETNEGSVVIRLVYGDTSFMLTGDASSDIEEHLAVLDADGLRTTVLKAGHHGSKHSTSDRWLAATDPEFVVVSAGRNNAYGHPSPEVIGRARASGASIVSTIDDGTLRFVSDGKGVFLR